MRLRIGLLKERKFLENVNDWTIEELECEVRKEFAISGDTNIGIYLGERRVNDSKGEWKLTELGIVSGDLLMTKVEPAGQSSSQECAENCQQSTSQAADAPLAELPASAPDECSGEQKIKASMLLSLIHERMKQIGYEEVDRYSLDEPMNKTEVYYYASERSNTRIRLACTLFFDYGLEQKNVHTVQCNITLINGKNMMHLDRKDFDDNTKLCAFDDFVEELKTAIFGQNPLLRTVFYTDIDLTLKIFELCGLDGVCALRKTCKFAYKKTSSSYIDQKYWRKEFVEIFRGETLPVNNNEPTPYRKELFKRIREHQRSTWIHAMRASARAGKFICHDRQREEYRNFYHVPARSLRPQRPNYDPLQVDLLRNFDDNFYGQEVYRPANPNPYTPGAPVVLPMSREARVVRQPSPSSDLNKPWQPFGSRHHDDRFI